MGGVHLGRLLLFLCNAIAMSMLLSPVTNVVAAILAIIIANIGGMALERYEV